MVDQSGNFAQLMGAAGGDPDKLQKLMNIFRRTQQGKGMMSATPQGGLGNVRALRPRIQPSTMQPGRRMPFQQQRNRRLAGI